MKHARLSAPALFIAAFVATSPATAHEDGEPILPSEQELRNLGEAAKQWLNGLTSEISPFVEQLGGLIDDLKSYEAPEMLPNGDIIIRRRPDAPPPEGQTMDL
ncbi:MAG: hypothetical protein ACPGGK_10910 [Pikeienuella sp.]